LLSGVLILSETAGAASELCDSILVNANDRQEIADAILLAMNMSPVEQRSRIKRMQNHLRKNDVLAWAANFLGAMNNIHDSVRMDYDKGY
jgi:trehalose 6-phosphate synthase/phosphatase